MSDEKPIGHNNLKIERINSEILIVGLPPLYFAVIVMGLLSLIVITLVHFSAPLTLFTIIIIGGVGFYTFKNFKQKENQQLEYLKHLTVKKQLKKYYDRDNILEILDIK